MYTFSLYIVIANLWMIYRMIFKKDKTNDISNCKNIFILALRYLLTITIGMPVFYLLILVSFITGLALGISFRIGNEAKKIKEIVNNNPYTLLKERYDIKLVGMMYKAKALAILMYINRYVIKVLSAIRKKLVV